MIPPQATAAQSIDKYRRHAGGYDRSAERTMPLRRRAIDLLELQPGQVVLDVGAGTGLSYEWLLQGVGERGRVLAFEQSPDMFEQARRRVRDKGWTRIWHCCESAHRVQLPEPADAALFNYVHDISRSPLAIEHLMKQVRPGGRIVIAGMKFFPWWTGPLNLLAWAKNRPYNVQASDLWSPWDRLEPWCDGFERWTTQWGMGYIASGRRRH